MTPFGPYQTFSDCVAQNSDKASPEAYCAWLEHKITGQWPSQSSMPAEVWSVYREAYSQYLDGAGKPVLEAEKEAAAHAQKAVAEAGWNFARMGWIKEYAAPKMRNVMGVRIFESGTWTDSSGNIREWTEADLDVLVQAFGSGVPAIVPMKAGHTPDSFNSAVAEKLGVPVDLVIGDHGKGQITIGRMATLERRGNILFASFERVPDSIAGLIEQGLYRTVSVEIEDNVGAFANAITAVALLGAEEPAVAGATLDRALVFGGKRDNAAVLTFANPETLEGEFSVLYDRMADTIKGMRGAPVFRALMQNLRGLFDQIAKKRKHETPPNTVKEETMPKKIKDLLKMQEEPEMPEVPEVPGAPTPQDEVLAALVAVAQALGLSDEASVEDILTAIEQLKAGAAPVEAQFQKAKSELQKATERIGKLEHSERVHGYLEQTRLFTAVPNRTPQDMAVELAELEEVAGKPRADILFSSYQDLHRAAAAAGTTLGTSLPGRSADFEAKVTEYQRDNPKSTRAEAVKHVMKAHPDLREQYRQDNQE